MCMIYMCDRSELLKSLRDPSLQILIIERKKATKPHQLWVALKLLFAHRTPPPPLFKFCSRSERMRFVHIKTIASI